MQKQGKKMKTDSENKKQANKKSTLHLTKLINSIIRDPSEVTKLQLITTTELKRYRMRGVEKKHKDKSVQPSLFLHQSTDLEIHSPPMPVAH